MAEIAATSRKSDLAEIRLQVESEKSRLDHEMAQLTGVATNGAGREAPFHEHPTEHAGEMEEHERLLAIRENLLQMFEQCDDALGRLERGEYGLCRSCGKEIAIERLRALPYATRCVPCKEAKRD
ncbi:MAG TPA: TraR/DksA C4-type zinc finger protein [Candidatus Saccharimonadales bacterium]|nr:TraR/DksA C4-type zinc finger protein [Candidatus Saccharimonadales bacterium]